MLFFFIKINIINWC